MAKEFVKQQLRYLISITTFFSGIVIGLIYILNKQKTSPDQPISPLFLIPAILLIYLGIIEFKKFAKDIATIETVHDFLEEKGFELEKKGQPYGRQGVKDDIFIEELYSYAGWPFDAASAPIYLASPCNSPFDLMFEVKLTRGKIKFKTLGKATINKELLDLIEKHLKPIDRISFTIQLTEDYLVGAIRKHQYTKKELIENFNYFLKFFTEIRDSLRTIYPQKETRINLKEVLSQFKLKERRLRNLSIKIGLLGIFFIVVSLPIYYYSHDLVPTGASFLLGLTLLLFGILPDKLGISPYNKGFFRY